MNFSLWMEAINNNDAETYPIEDWIFDSATSGSLIARGDSAVYGQQTESNGLAVDIALNVNNTRLDRFYNGGGPVEWVTFDDRFIGMEIWNDPTGALAGGSTVYRLVQPVSAGVSGFVADPPSAGVNATSLTVNHMFPSEGVFFAQTRFVLNGVGSETRIEGYVVLASA